MDFGDHRSGLGTLSAVPLLGGDAGVAQTIAHMRSLIDAGVKNPDVNGLAINIIRQSGAPPHDEIAQAKAIFEWVLRNIYFVNDPVGVDQDGEHTAKELPRPPEVTLQLGAGDCDCFVVLMCTMLQTIGIRTRIVTIACDPSDPSQFTHVYPEAFANGEWVSVDAARPGASFGVEPEICYRKKVWDKPPSIRGLFGAHQQRFSLNGYAALKSLRSLGDDSTIAQDITAASTGAADVILASDAAPQNIYGTVSTTAQPNAGYTGGYTSISPYAGYSTVVSSPFGTLSGSGLVIGAVVLVGMFMLLKD
jgi:hypothetical protein